MCGLVGYVGRKQAGPILMEGLRKLEYRGYDSAGLAVRDGDGDIDVVRAKGRLSVLSEKTLDGSSMKAAAVSDIPAVQPMENPRRPTPTRIPVPEGMSPAYTTVLSRITRNCGRSFCGTVIISIPRQTPRCW